MRTRTGVALAALVALAAASTGHAATFNVTRTDDPSPGACDSDCSLREAVLAANATGGLDTINVPAGRFRLTRAGTGEDAGATGDLDLTENVDIGGRLGATVIDAGGVDRVLEVQPGVTASILRVTITGGLVDGSGGGIENRGVLTLGDDTITGNQALVPASNAGGGVDSSGTLIVNGSTISANRAYNGGGIAFAGSLKISNSTIAQNVAGARGFNGDGGGVSGSGGASVTLESSTVAGNVSFNGSSSGGGINASAATLTNTIVAENVSHLPDQTATFLDNCSVGTLTSQGHNLSDGSDCNLSNVGDRQNGDPRLGPLADNGGPTPTKALLPGSQARDAGAGCPMTDQRRALRPAASCDIGAYEVAPPQPTVMPPNSIGTTSATLVGMASRSVQLTLYRFEFESVDETREGSTPAQWVAPGETAQLLAPIAGLRPGTAYRFHLLGQNADGTATSADLTFTTLERIKPVLKLLKVSPGIFRARKGAKFSFTLSEDATVTFKVDRVLPGVRRNRRCVAKRPRLRGRACTRYLPVNGSFTVAGKAGRNTIPFDAKLNGKTLRPSAYRLRAAPKDASGNVGRTVIAAFRIVR
jgi:CSLREA domain-containing protein